MDEMSINENLHQAELTPSRSKHSCYPGSPGSPNYPSFEEMLREVSSTPEEAAAKPVSSEQVFAELPAFTITEECKLKEVVHPQAASPDPRCDLIKEEAKNTPVPKSPDQEDEKENGQISARRGRRSSGKSKVSKLALADKENAGVQEFESKLSRRRYHVDEAGAEFTKEGELGEKSDCSFYVHHETQFTPRGSRKMLPDFSKELAAREEQNGIREQGIEAQEQEMTKTQEELSRLEEAMTYREAKAQDEEQQLTDEDNSDKLQKTLAEDALRERRRRNEVKVAALKELTAELAESQGEIDDVEAELVESRRCSLEKILRKAIRALQYVLVRGVLLGAVILTLHQLGAVDEASHSASCPSMVEPCPTPVPVPPVFFRAEPPQGFPNSTVELASGAQGCFHSEDKQTPEFLHHQLAEAQRLKTQNADLQHKLEEVEAALEENAKRAAEAQKLADDQFAERKRLEQQIAQEAQERKRAEEEAAAAQKQLEEQRAQEAEQRRRLEEAAAAQKKLEEQRARQAEEQRRAEEAAAAKTKLEEQKRKKLEEQRAREAEEQKRKKLEEQRAREAKEQAAEALVQSASIVIPQSNERSGEPLTGHELEVESFEAAKAPRAVVVDPPRGASMRWTALFVTTAAATREVLFALNDLR